MYTITSENFNITVSTVTEATEVITSALRMEHVQRPPACTSSYAAKVYIGDLRPIRVPVTSVRLLGVEERLQKAFVKAFVENPRRTTQMVKLGELSITITDDIAATA